MYKDVYSMHLASKDEALWDIQYPDYSMASFSPESNGTAAASTLSPEELNELAEIWHTWYEEYGHDFFKPVEMPDVAQTPPPTEQSQADEIAPGEDLNPLFSLPIAFVPVATRKFKCPVCGKSFARQQRLEACENNHRNEKPYHCRSLCGEPNCTSSFLSKSGMNRHIRPLQERCIACEHCNMDILRQNMARHRKSCLKRLSVTDLRTRAGRGV